MRLLKLLGGTEPLRFSWRGSAAPFFIWEGKTMPNYEQLYHLMVNASEDALAALESGNVWDAKRILIAAERQAEQQYIEES